MDGRINPGQYRRHRGSGIGSRRDAVLKDHALLGKLIYIGGFTPFVSMTREMVFAQSINADDYHIEPLVISLFFISTRLINYPH
ncbi:hypothetical protein ES703_88782 [subsurface metagenome]